MERVRVLLVDDHDLVRTGVRLVLQRLEGVEVVGEAGDGREAVRLVETLTPDLVFMDIMMPSLNGLEALKHIGLKFPKTRVVVLSMNSSEEYVMQSLSSGACGYLVKNISPAELDTAIRAVMNGETYISPEVSRHPDLAAFRRGGGSNLDQTSYDRLTPRQREVLQLIAEGHSTKEIARKLDISVKTVEMHRAQLMTSLDIHDVAGLVRYAIRRGVVSPDR
jgi:DNA-binding NarL/FixJ family response regulator